MFLVYEYRFYNTQNGKYVSIVIACILFNALKKYDRKEWTVNYFFIFTRPHEPFLYAIFRIIRE